MFLCQSMIIYSCLGRATKLVELFFQIAVFILQKCHLFRILLHNWSNFIVSFTDLHFLKLNHLIPLPKSLFIHFICWSNYYFMSKTFYIFVSDCYFYQFAFSVLDACIKNFNEHSLWRRQYFISRQSTLHKLLSLSALIVEPVSG